MIDSSTASCCQPGRISHLEFTQREREREGGRESECQRAGGKNDFTLNNLLSLNCLDIYGFLVWVLECLTFKR